MEMIEPFPRRDPVAELTLFRVGDPKFVLIYVEGDSDVDMWKPWFHWKPIVPGGGKPGVLAAIRKLEQNHCCGFLGIVDADHDTAGPWRFGPNVVTSQTHDLEGDIVGCRAFLHYAEHTFPEGIGNPRNLASGSAIRLCLLDLAKVIGAARFLVHTRSAEWPDRLNGHRLLLSGTLEVNRTMLVHELAPLLGVPEHTIEREIEAILSSRSAASLANGHDLMVFLWILVNTYGRAHARQKSPDHLRNQLFLVMSRETLGELAIYQQVQQWEQGNHPFQILKHAEDSCHSPHH